MSNIASRGALQFPDNDGNHSHTFINGKPFNQLALVSFNYTLYSNSTVSNGTNCYLVFGKYAPVFLDNGTWINGTSCFIPYYPIRAIGGLWIAFAVAFGVMLVFAALNLWKHGKRHCPRRNLPKPMGRRRPWYWMIVVSACGIASSTAGVNADRIYLPDTSVVLQSFFFTVLLPAALAMVWETSRHWGSFHKRLLKDSSTLRRNLGRDRVEFWLPVAFYLLTVSTLSLTIPRSWLPLKLQRAPEQQLEYAVPIVADIRFKLSGLFAACAWILIVFSLFHSLYYYVLPSPNTRGTQSPARWSLEVITAHNLTKLCLAVTLLALRIGYAIASAWNFNISIYDINVELKWPVGLGYGSTIVMLFVLIVRGRREENDDVVLLAQRKEREKMCHTQMGVRRFWLGRGSETVA